jgi:PqqD family protein of HPr-rel-A system
VNVTHRGGWSEPHMSSIQPASRTDATIEHDVLPRRRELPLQNIHDELMLRDPESGEVHFLNPAAAVIWQACDGATLSSECESLLRAAFQIPVAADLQGDIREALADFAKRGLLIL